MSYDFKAVEQKWQKIWDANPYGKAKNVGEGKKYYGKIRKFMRYYPVTLLLNKILIW